MAGEARIRPALPAAAGDAGRVDQAPGTGGFSPFLLGGLTYSLVYQIDPRVLPIVLRDHGATNEQIAIIIGSLTLLINSIVEPIVGYRSDRARGRWGRRIPFIFWVTPVVSLLIVAVPFAPGFAERALRVGWMARAAAALPWPPVILAFAAFILLYKIFYNVVAAIYLCLIADVVPQSRLGRFHAQFRILGALATFAGNYWLVGLAATHPRAVFAGLALLNLVGFWAVCAWVREHDYPPLTDPPDQGGGGGVSRFLRAAGSFLRVAYRHPVYRWTYLTRVMIFGVNAATAFVIFFGREDLGLTYDRSGKLLAYSSLGWILLAYPVGRLLDRWGSVRALGRALALGTAAYAASFFLIVGARSFLVASLVTNTIFWFIWSAEIMLAQQIFHRDRMAQLTAANSIAKSVVIAFGLSPLTGWLLDHLRGHVGVISVPVVGLVRVGQYRFIFPLLAGMCAVAWLALGRVGFHWRRLGGPAAYRAPDN
jgi:Na+/melibiose symporter-like transporter